MNIVVSAWICSSHSYSVILVNRVANIAKIGLHPLRTIIQNESPHICANDCTISLLSRARKVFLQVILERIRTKVEAADELARFHTALQYPANHRDNESSLAARGG